MAVPRFDEFDDDELDAMMVHIREATTFLKALSHEGRLAMLCHLSTGEKTVTEFEELLSLRQAAVSQQLMRLRSDGLVTTRRDGKAIYYCIADPKVATLVSTLHDMFCSDDST